MYDLGTPGVDDRRLEVDGVDGGSFVVACDFEYVTTLELAGIHGSEQSWDVVVVVAAGHMENEVAEEEEMAAVDDHNAIADDQNQTDH